MADEPQVLRGIDWREAFPFTHVFRAFRIAIHPSKLVLALAAMICLYLGGWVLDRIWLAAAGRGVIPGEIQLYETSKTQKEFQANRDTLRDAAAREYAILLQQAARAEGGQYQEKATDPQKALEAARKGQDRQIVYKWIAAQRDEKVRAADQAYEQVRNDKSKDKAAVAEAARQREERVRQAYAESQERKAKVAAVCGRGIFDAFISYQAVQAQQVVNSVLSGNWLGGLPGGVTSVDGVYKSAYKFFAVAPAWMLRHHWLYFLVYGVWVLAILSLFGGAIARIAAVHVADEGRKLSMRQGLSFALSKFLSFFSAPLIPLVIVAGIGLVVAVVGGLAMLLRLDILVGALYFLALGAGFVMTLVLLGTAGGMSLMYPTIAVEGSDSFDAISRSFSYVYSRPWRMLLYSSVAIAYGAVTHFFVRIFIWLMLLLTQFFVGLFVFRTAADGSSNLWETLLPRVSFSSLRFGFNLDRLNTYGDLTSILLICWSYLVISMLGAFAISFYFSANTIIYYLMRKEVDATAMDDVYLEEAEEELPGTTPAPAAATATSPTAAPAPEPAASAPPAQQSQDSPGSAPGPSPQA